MTAGAGVVVGVVVVGDVVVGDVVVGDVVVGDVVVGGVEGAGAAVVITVSGSGPTVLVVDDAGAGRTASGTDRAIVVETARAGALAGTDVTTDCLRD